MFPLTKKEEEVFVQMKKEEVFEEIEALAVELEIKERHIVEAMRWYKEQLRQAQARYHFLADVEYSEFQSWRQAKYVVKFEKVENWRIAGPTGQDNPTTSPTMSEPKTREEVWEELEVLGLPISRVDQTTDKYKDWFEDQIEQRRARYPSMANATFGDFLRWKMGKMAQEVRDAKTAPKPTAQDFWKAAWEYDPLGPNPQPNGSDLLRIIMPGHMEPISIGKIYGEVLLKLLPTLGALPAPDIPGFDGPFDFAATDSGAISYPDGHPSEEQLGSFWDDLPGGDSKRPSQKPPVIKAADDDKLRRFAALGWVLQQEKGRNGQWKKTGHVLVIDMDDRDIQQRQPWLVLASSWPTDGAETPEGGFTIYAEEEVGLNDSAAAGVFPGDKNRTPICRIMPKKGKGKGNIPVLQQLGDDFKFVPQRLAGHRATKKSPNGPALAKVMEWYWDPVAEQEVCYTEQGLEYMRYDRRTKAYSFPDFSRLSFAGEERLFGEIVAPPAKETPEELSGRPVSLAERLARISIGCLGSSRREKSMTHTREKSSSMGF
ncbi:MAG: hypothetical protein Q9221_001908 [Calogaya cf. arnoldii]